MPSFLLAIAFGAAFFRLTNLNKKVGGIFCDPKLMGLHYSVFVAGVFFDIVLLGLHIAHRKNRHSAFEDGQITTREHEIIWRIEIAELALSLM